MANIKQIKHLTARAGFGMRFEDAKAAEKTSVKDAVKALFKTSDNIEQLTVVKESIDYMMNAKADADARKMFMQQQRQQERELNLAWIKQMSATNAVLREKMTLFWNNHFACRSNNAFFAQQLNNLHRTHALGNFRNMLLEVSRSPAMLQFLNNQQNVKNHPNENFGRELMELFTIGRGNYTEDDVKNAARAFTGWAFDRTGQFIQRPFVHDNDQKTFLGKTGNFNGEDIINALLEKKQTAYFISNKLYKYLVNEVPDTAHVTAMADVFYKSGYEIKPLLEFVFNASWFYDDKNTG